MDITLLGGLQLRADGGRELELPAGRTRLLAGYLAYCGSHGAPRERLAAWLWPDSSAARARANLRQTLLLMRRILGDALQSDADSVRLLGHVDVHAFEALAGSTAPSDRARAESLYRGPLLDGIESDAEFFEQWLRETREQLHGSARQLLLLLTTERRAYGDMTGALMAGEHLLRLEPSCEAAHLALMQLHHERGARDAVLRQYRRLEQALSAELGLEPAESSRRLRDTLLTEVVAEPAAPLRGRVPGVAVMPFTNASPEATEDYFVDGLAEEIIAGLARYRSLRVAARHSTHAFRARALAAPAIGRELDVEFLLEASVRRSGERLRVTTLLIEAANGHHVWSERFEGLVTEWFDFQDRMASKIVAHLSLSIEAAALSGSRYKAPQRLDAYDRWLQGLHHLRRGTVADDVIARGHFERALDLDPRFARAYTGLSLSHFNEWSCQAWNEWEMRQQLAFDFATRAVELDDGDHITHCVLGKILLYRRELALAERHLDRSLSLNANDADTLTLIAVGMMQLGRLEEAALLAEQALELNPRPPTWYYQMLAQAHYCVGQYGRALQLIEQAPRVFVDGPLLYALLCQQRGELGAARQWWSTFVDEFRDKILGGRAPQPDEPLRWLDRVTPIRDPAQHAHLFAEIRSLAAPTQAVSGAPA